VRKRYWEDFQPGDRLCSSTSVVSEQSIIEFGRQFDPQPFHLNARDAVRTMVKGLMAGGWHTPAVSMRLFVDAMNVPGGMIGLGVDELRWPIPVRPGDELRVATEVVEARRSKSRPGTGIIRFRNVTTNQRGEIVQTISAGAMLPMREAAEL
jgi:acyl dehydratase